MQTAVTQELMEILCLAVKHGLIPPGTQEFEFTVDRFGQASAIEYWTCPERKTNEYSKVNIPTRLLDQFVFHTVVFYSLLPVSWL